MRRITSSPGGINCGTWSSRIGGGSAAEAHIRACPSRKSHPNVLVVQSGQNGDRSDRAKSLNASIYGCVLL